jgi:hypothetical protein
LEINKTEIKIQIVGTRIIAGTSPSQESEMRIGEKNTKNPTICKNVETGL